MFTTEILGRIQFGTTTVYHFLFVPLTLGLSILVAFLHTRYYKSGDEQYKKLAKYFGTLFLINFSMGVVTGIVQEFQFGMNWSSYSRFVGDIFGAPLAVEALAAFFIESTFLGLWIFGWEKLPKKVHLACIWLVAFASNLSAFWILVANSFMQEPVGYVLRNGRAEMTDIFALIKNPHVWLQFPHTVLSGFVTAAVFIMAISAYNILKRKNVEMFKKAMKIGIIFGGVSLLLTIGVGDLQGKYLVKHQPMKMAAAEAIWESEQPAAFSVFGAIDQKNKKNSFELKIPRMLSFLSYGNFYQKVEGINDIQKQMEAEYGPGNYIPPVSITYYSFRIMVATGMLMLGIIVLAGLILFMGRGFTRMKWLQRLILVLLPLPYLANSTGWIMTEMGRQPWIVYGLMKVQDGVSKSVQSGVVLASLIGFVAVYGVLIVVAIWLSIRFIKKEAAGADVDEATAAVNGAKGGELWI